MIKKKYFFCDNEGKYGIYSNNIINGISIGSPKSLSKRFRGYYLVVYLTLIIYTLIFSIKRVRY